ncbi:hypothetical protein D3C78_1882100 [compost metagenome]
MTEDHTYTLREGFSFIGLRSTSQCTLKIVQDRYQLGNQLHGCVLRKLFLLLLGTAAEVVEIRLRTKKTLLLLFQFGG